MPFCARCLGASIGHISSLILAAIGILIPPVLALLFIGIMLLDWSLQQFLGIMSTNARRLVTGIAGGVGVNSILLLTVVTIIRLASGA